MTEPAVQDLLDQLVLSRTGTASFRAVTGKSSAQRYRRLFGGQVAAQSLRAAQHTVRDGLYVHSLHGYFLATGRQGDPLTLEVETLRDGGSFSVRRVAALQDDEPIFTMLASFHREEVGEEYALVRPDVPDPDDPDVEWAPQPHPDYPPTAAFEFREIAVPTPDGKQGHAPSRRCWVRPRGPLPDDRELQECVLTHLSDQGGLTAMVAALGYRWDHPRRAASLDHTVHFHRHLRLEDWVLFDMCPVSNAGNRALIRTTVHARDGVLGTSISQEGLVRIP